MILFLNAHNTTMTETQSSTGLTIASKMESIQMVQAETVVGMLVVELNLHLWMRIRFTTPAGMMQLAQTLTLFVGVGRISLEEEHQDQTREDRPGQSQRHAPCLEGKREREIVMLKQIRSWETEHPTMDPGTMTTVVYVVAPGILSMTMDQKMRIRGTDPVLAADLEAQDTAAANNCRTLQVGMIQEALTPDILMMGLTILSEQDQKRAQELQWKSGRTFCVALPSYPSCQYMYELSISFHYKRSEC